jgi:hypothetical protein
MAFGGDCHQLMQLYANEYGRLLGFQCNIRDKISKPVDFDYQYDVAGYVFHADALIDTHSQ